MRYFGRVSGHMLNGWVPSGPHGKPRWQRKFELSF
jgi:hypothetical protein